MSTRRATGRGCLCAYVPETIADLPRAVWSICERWDCTRVDEGVREGVREGVCALGREHIHNVPQCTATRRTTRCLKRAATEEDNSGGRAQCSVTPKPTNAAPLRLRIVCRQSPARRCHAMLWRWWRRLSPRVWAACHGQQEKSKTARSYLFGGSIRRFSSRGQAAVNEGVPKTREAEEGNMPHDIVLLVSIPVHGHSPASVHSWAWVVGVGFVRGVLGFVGKIEVAKTIAPKDSDRLTGAPSQFTTNYQSIHTRMCFHGSAFLAIFNIPSDNLQADHMNQGIDSSIPGFTFASELRYSRTSPVLQVLSWAITAIWPLTVVHIWIASQPSQYLPIVTVHIILYNFLHMGAASLVAYCFTVHTIIHGLRLADI
ncbi:hypothetical protein FB451DRAFT_1170338 [Mycena latifolia]|nr:hypothetical protein FB451DRAFT_1170338 [Mycena latifolia]